MSRVKGVFLTHRNNRITVRPRSEHESFPTHEAFRLLIDHTVHLVQGCNVYRLAITLKFEPENNWPKCPDCRRPDWSVWMPVHINHHDVWDGKVDTPEIYTTIEWYILCLHCKHIVVKHDCPPYNLSGVTEYVYDPVNDVNMRLWPDASQRKRHT